MRKNGRRRIVLGLNASHDASACLLVDGEIAVAVPEERLSRVKHQKGFPRRAVEYCLQAAGVTLDDVGAIVLNEPMATDYGSMLRENLGFRGELIVNPSHHMLHAYYAVVASGMRHPAVLVMDGSGYSYAEHSRHESPLLGPAPPYGDMEEAESTYRVDASGELELVDKRWGLWVASSPLIRFPSLGHMYSAASQYIFRHVDHAGKTMGLAAYGDASRFPEPIVRFGDEGLTIDTLWCTRLPPRSILPAHADPVCRDLAAKVQQELEAAVLFLCRRLFDATGADELCLSGGVGLNTVTNARILSETRFRKLFVTPAAGDSGISIGGALFGDRRLTGTRASWPAYDNFHGRACSPNELTSALGRYEHLVRWERKEDIEQAAARDLAAGVIIGWFEGRSEFGPRALGHRSIVCDPRPAAMRDRLNETVKYREPFRPYAASVLSEHASEYFELTHDDPFMMTAVRLADGKQELMPSISHVDGTCRIQTVDRGCSGRYRALIEAFHALSGVPVLLNTSFNVRGEPMVETPTDALRCFLSCNLDVLYMDDYRITKAVPGDCAAEDLIPYVNEGVSFRSRAETRAGAALEPRYSYRTRTGYEGDLRREEYELLLFIDANRSVAELQQLARSDGSRCDAEAMTSELQRRGLLSFKIAARLEHGAPA